MSGLVRLAAAAAGLAVLTACGNPGFPAREHVAQYLAPAVRAPLPHTPASYLGVYEPGVPRTYAQVDAFTAAGRPLPQPPAVLQQLGPAVRDIVRGHRACARRDTT